MFNSNQTKSRIILVMLILLQEREQELVKIESEWRRELTIKNSYSVSPGIQVEQIEATSFSGSSPFLSPGNRERERETLENAGHMSPRIWKMTKHNMEGGAGKSGVMERICQPLPQCYVFQGLSLALQGKGRRWPWDWERALLLLSLCQHCIVVNSNATFQTSKGPPTPTSLLLFINKTISLFTG